MAGRQIFIAPTSEQARIRRNGGEQVKPVLHGPFEFKRSLLG